MLGLGLIGGSLLRRLTLDGAAAVGFDSDPATVAAAGKAGLAAHSDLAAALAGADLVVLAVPLPGIAELVGAVAAGDSAPILTDVVSVKAQVARVAHERAPALRYVGGHPMAGTERSGFAAADPTLFDGAAWALCLDPGTDRDPGTDLNPGTDLDAWLTVARLAVDVGARVVPTTAAAHDRAVAAASHVPHLLAAALADAVGSDPLAVGLAAGSFRDATRVMQSRPELVAAMCDGNAEALGPALDDVVRRLGDLREAVSAGTGLLPAFAAAQEVRRRWDTRFNAREIALERSDPGLRDRLLDVGATGGWVDRIGTSVIRAWLPRGSGDGDRHGAAVGD